MKKPLILVLVISLLSAPFASAASIAGSKCSKVSATKSVKGQLYKCQSKNKKLIWVSVAAPIKSAPKGPITPQGAAFLVADYPLIGSIARENFQKYTSDSKGSFEVFWDSTTTSAKRTWIGQQISEIEIAYSQLMPTDSKVTLLVLGADVEWSRNQLRILSKDSQSFWDDYNNRFYVSTLCAKPNGYVITDNVFPADYTTYRALGGGVAPGKGFGFVTMSNCDDYIEKDVLFHEAFHAVQFLNSYRKAPSYGNQSWGWGLLPPWIREGQAQYVGLRMSNKFLGKNVMSDSDGVIRWNAGNRWKSEYEYLTTYETGDPYWIGAIMHEYLIAKFGLAKCMDIYSATVMKDAPGNIDIPDRYAPFDQAFLEVFGQTRQSFYEEVKPYIQWSFSEKSK